MSAAEQKPDNCMVWAILTTLLCCAPSGIVSIIYASKVNDLWASNQYDKARQQAKNAATWAIVGAAVGLFFYFIYIICLIAAD